MRPTAPCRNRPPTSRDHTTAVHAHAALFGVYGMLGIGLMLFCLRGLTVRRARDERLPKWGFWGLNIGLAMMLFLSLLPIGAIQGWAAVGEGFWYARLVEVVQSALVRSLVWMRVPGVASLPHLQWRRS